MVLMGLDKLAGGTLRQVGDFKALGLPCGWILEHQGTRFIPSSLYPLGMYQGTYKWCQLTRFHWTERRGPWRLSLIPNLLPWSHRYRFTALFSAGLATMVISRRHDIRAPLEDTRWFSATEFRAHDPASKFVGGIPRVSPLRGAGY